MKIQTGKGTISLLALISIWSICALISLPGLAISPILGKLSIIFPKSTQIELQLLSSLPSLMIIPFTILSGKLIEKINRMYILWVGLGVFTLCGILYLFSTQMWQLIVVSGLLGIGAGLIIPLSTGFISLFFIGRYRVKQFGLCSSIACLSVGLITLLTGYLAEIKWNLPFVVYLLPIITIILSFSLRRDIRNLSLKNSINSSPRVSSGLTTSNSDNFGRYGIQIKYLSQLMIMYALMTIVCAIVALNVPFLIKEYNLSSGISGIIISIFWLSMMLPGLYFGNIIDLLRDNTIFYSVLLIFIGLFIFVFLRIELMLFIGSFFVGSGYGIIQPLIYEKTTIISSSKRATLALSLTMSMNYLAILIAPSLYTLYQTIFHNRTEQLPFIINMIIALMLLVWAFFKKNIFILREIS